MQEKNEFFIRAGQMEDEDDLMDELNQLEADMAEDELAQLEIGTGSVAIGGGAQREPTNVVQNKVQNEEDELRALEQMMA